jgi:hypothetical protein
MTGNKRGRATERGVRGKLEVGRETLGIGKGEVSK